MANVAHSSLTGTDLHEIKGASTATSGQVPIANGSGNAPFGKLDHNSLQTTGNPFGGQLLHVRDEKTVGSNGGSSVVNTWTTRVLNTVKTNEISGSSLGSNQITLPAGTYHIRARMPYYALNFCIGRIYNVTAGTTLIYGSSTYSTTGAQVDVNLEGRFTLAGTSAIALQYYTTGNIAGNGLGNASSLQTEVYSDVLIWRVA